MIILPSNNWSHTKLVSYLSKYNDDDLISLAFASTNRKQFLPENVQENAFEDKALPIGFGQIATRPSVIAKKLKLLKIKPEDNVLHIGSGTGYMTSIIAKILSKDSKAVGVERIQYFWEKSREQNNISNLKFLYQDINNFNTENYSIVISSVIAPELEKSLVKSLPLGGKLLLPTGNHITKYIYKGMDKKIVVEMINDFSDFEFNTIQNGLM